MSVISMPLWNKSDEKDKYPGEPEGAFMLQGNMTIDIPADITLKAGSKMGVSIKRNKNKKEGDKQPDFRGEFYAFTEREGQ